MNEEYYIELEDLKILNKPLSAKELKKIIKVDYRFMSTMFGIGKENGDKIWNYIIDNCI